MAKLVLSGHNLIDYEEMFDLKRNNLPQHILEYGSGATAVNCELTAQGFHIISCDELFAFDEKKMMVKVRAQFEQMINAVIARQQCFDFTKDGGLEAFLTKRREGLNTFLEDYPQGRVEGRYIADCNQFTDFSFDIAVCSHYLFTNLPHQNVEYHLKTIKKLAKLAKEVRIFPLSNEFSEAPQVLGPVLLDLHKNNYGVEVKSVNYHLQAQGNVMLRVWAQECPLA